MSLIDVSRVSEFRVCFGFDVFVSIWSCKNSSRSASEIFNCVLHYAKRSTLSEYIPAECLQKTLYIFYVYRSDDNTGQHNFFGLRGETVSGVYRSRWVLKWHLFSLIGSSFWDIANYVFFVSANPRELILIASTFTGIEISHQIFIVLFGL